MNVQANKARVTIYISRTGFHFLQEAVNKDLKESPDNVKLVGISMADSPQVASIAVTTITE